VIELLAADRQSIIIAAFWMLVAAGAIVSIGAWILLRREVRGQRPASEEPAEPAEAAEADDADVTL
jgi:hypothetical protein